MSNLSTLNSIMFAQLERLADPHLKGAALAEEIDRSKAISNARRDILASARLTLEAADFQKEWAVAKMPEILAIEKK